MSAYYQQRGKKIKNSIILSRTIQREKQKQTKSELNKVQIHSKVQHP